ncbi:hypothetical protein [Hafnia alvei]|uniref:hypothetical protein n=1 Tax=Hafnia alvei TaxID=569 RepID=UPI000E03212A|nr:hypothetical protein [Hafnia alvei]STQ71485.1 Uncharacterised protein [Hafnia alvei]STQ74383.1 Uncharacterised protein [Hafnia alvei]
MNKLILIGALLLAGCTDPTEATKVLQDNGYTDIRIGGYSWLGCSENDQFSTEFIAKSSTGRDVKGVVCSGWMKGSTVRFF